jgi:hypothetical protein
MTLSCDAGILRDDTGGVSWPAALHSGRSGLQPRLLSPPILCPYGSHRAIISALIPPL